MALVKELGESEALKRLDMSRQAFGRAVGGLPIRKGTAALMELRLKDSEGEKAA